MKYSRVTLASIGYELAPDVVSSEELEERLAPVYARLHIPHGQLEALTGIRERRWWESGFRLSDGAILAARKALAGANVEAKDIGAVVYAGVCRENFEPATACRVADALGVRGAVAVYDISNACLGVLNGILDIANRIELGQMKAGLVVSCESAREINELAIERLLSEATMDSFKEGLATLTGGSGATAVLLTDGSFGRGHKLLGGVYRAAPEHNELCRWGLEGDSAYARRGPEQPQGNVLTRSGLKEVMKTDAIGVLKNGVSIGRQTWQDLVRELDWKQPDKVICHQVGSANREGILKALSIPAEKDFSTFEYLGNMGSAALPSAAAIAAERGFLKGGDKVAWLGIGSGLNCLMLGLEW